MNYEEDYEPRDGKRLSKTGRKLVKQWRAESFRCVACGVDVPQTVLGSQNRNHCPLCLWSRHVDEAIGDRRATCLAGMEPVGLAVKSTDQELMLVHLCRGCAKVSTNRLAGDDNAAAVLSLFVESSKHIKNNQENYPDIRFVSDQAQVEEALLGRR